MDARIKDTYRPVEQRRNDYAEVERELSLDEIRQQSRRCMNCGIPFCHGAGCPLCNVIPEFNAAIASGNDLVAWQILSSTSSFPEFTSRVCPALCEGSCTCGICEEPVMIRQMEKYVVDTAFKNGWVKPAVPARRNGKAVAVVGGGPAGLTAADILNREGFNVTLYERNHKLGGLLRYGIPDFKLDKRLIDRRAGLMSDAGIVFALNSAIGVDISAKYLRDRHDAVVLALGTPVARDIDIPGRDLGGIHLALEFLQGQNRLNAGEVASLPISAKGKRVLVIGGGDTGSDCIGTALRQGATEVVQVEIMPEPPAGRSESTPWPDWPYQKRTSSSHHEGSVQRRWNIASRRFLGKDGRVCGVEISQVSWALSPQGKPLKSSDVADSTEVIEADLVLLAMGFTGVPREGAVAQLDLKLTPRTAVIPDPARQIYAVGDCASGAGLVVRAMEHAQRVALEIASALA